MTPVGRMAEVFFWVGYWSSLSYGHGCAGCAAVRDGVVADCYPGGPDHSALADYGLTEWPTSCGRTHGVPKAEVIWGEEDRAIALAAGPPLEDLPGGKVSGYGPFIVGTGRPPDPPLEERPTVPKVVPYVPRAKR